MLASKNKQKGDFQDWHTGNRSNMQKKAGKGKIKSNSTWVEAGTGARHISESRRVKVLKQRGNSQLIERETFEGRGMRSREIKTAKIIEGGGHLCWSGELSAV